MVYWVFLDFECFVSTFGHFNQCQSDSNRNQRTNRKKMCDEWRRKEKKKINVKQVLPHAAQRKKNTFIGDEYMELRGNDGRSICSVRIETFSIVIQLKELTSDKGIPWTPDAEMCNVNSHAANSVDGRVLLCPLPDDDDSSRMPVMWPLRTAHTNTRYIVQYCTSTYIRTTLYDCSANETFIGRLNRRPLLLTAIPFQITDTVHYSQCAFILMAMRARVFGCSAHFPCTLPINRSYL